MTIADQTQKSKDSVPFSRKHPFRATLREVKHLNKPGSSKQNLHVVLDLEGSEISYNVGSSFGIYPENSPEDVEEVLECLGVPAKHIVYDKRDEGALTLEAYLRKKANIAVVTSKHLKLVEKYNPSERLSEVLSTKEALIEYTSSADLATFLNDFWSPAIEVQHLCDVLSPLLPRYYSIASSEKIVGNKVELMVASFSYEKAGKTKYSITASYLESRCKINESKIALFLMENKHFMLPTDRKTPIIMIGPGTGFAAFRGFLQERYALDPKEGNQWLFTGDRNRATDFFYEDELTKWESEGFLKLNLAFSRDRLQKYYVQDEMKANGKELWRWIQDGAHLYICGDAKHMAKDVNVALISIAMEHGNFSEEEAKVYFKELKKSGKFALDIY